MYQPNRGLIERGKMIENLNDDDNIVLAKDIDDCSVCPLYKKDCKGGWTSGGGGEPIEPPCCSWNKNDEIYEGMYSNNTYEPSEQEIAWEKERSAEKEKCQKEKREAEEKEQTLKLLNQVTRYGNAKIKQGGELCYNWYCPKCRRWFHAWHESCHGGITETNCNYCGETLAHSWLL